MSEFPFKVGDKITRDSWQRTAPMEWLCVEWIGDFEVAGINQDGKRTAHNIGGSCWRAWVRKRWIIETEHRLAKNGETCLNKVMMTGTVYQPQPFFKATGDVHDVVVSVVECSEVSA